MLPIRFVASRDWLQESYNQNTVESVSPADCEFVRWNADHEGGGGGARHLVATSVGFSTASARSSSARAFGVDTLLARAHRAASHAYTLAHFLLSRRSVVRAPASRKYAPPAGAWLTRTTTCGDERRRASEGGLGRDRRTAGFGARRALRILGV